MLLACVTASVGASLALAGEVGSSRSDGPVPARAEAIAPGVSLLKYRVSGPNRVRVLRIDPTRASVDVGLAGSVWPAYATTSEIARAHRAVGAINGDFAIDGHPFHPYAEDGAVATTGRKTGFGFNVRLDGTDPGAGKFPFRMSATDEAAGASRSVERLNDGPPPAGALGGYTRTGGSVERPPTNTCAARLVPAAAPAWEPGGNGVVRSYSVDARRCAKDRLKPGTAKQVVLAAPSSSGGSAGWVRALAVGGEVTLSWRVPDRPYVTDQQGGSPLLLDDGDIVAPATCGSYFCGKNPRSGVGYAPDGTVFFVTVDGRQTGSVGMTLPRFAEVFLDLGATWAVNMDGGASTTMVVKDGAGYDVVNSPATSNGAQRLIVTAYLVHAGTDGGEPPSLANGLAARTLSSPPADPIEAASHAAIAAAERSALGDPGSTGGLLEARLRG
ncbi:MAG: phosphodiester glycosidase family protein [Actinomycetota bacterium]